jgi:NADPH:quinone reductase-like Zn-dependent oxidoreductase
MTIHAFLPSGDDALVTLSTVETREPAPDEALVAVDAYSVNRGEILLLADGRADPPGKDIAGRVLRAAADGGGPAPGTRIVAHVEGGGWAEQLPVRADQLVPLPDEVTAEAAAALPLAGLTALRLVRAIGELAGRRILVTGASGGVGHYFVELAAAGGAGVTAVARTAERGARLLGLGAERIVTSVPDAEGPFDVVLESVGGDVMTDALGKLAPGGLLLWFGMASLQPPTLDFFALPPGVTIRHFVYWTQANRDAEDLATLVDLVATGRLHPEIGTTATWEQTPQVLTAVRNRDVRGNAVLTLPQAA